MKKLFLMISLIFTILLVACKEKTPEKVKLTGVYNGTRIEIGALKEGESFSNFREMYAQDGMLNLIGSVYSESGAAQVVLILDTATGEWSRT